MNRKLVSDIDSRIISQLEGNQTAIYEYLDMTCDWVVSCIEANACTITVLQMCSAYRIVCKEFNLC